MTDLHLRLGPRLWLRFEDLPDDLGTALARFLGYFVVEEAFPARGGSDELVVRRAAAPVARLEPVSAPTPDSPLQISRAGPLLHLRTGSVAVWYDPPSERAGIEVEEPTPREVHDFLSYALPHFLFAVGMQRGMAGLHAAAIQVGSAGILLPAPGGSGKTTLYRQACERGVGVLSDDLVWVVDTERGFTLEPFPRGRPARPVPGPTVERAALSAIVLPSVGRARRGCFRPIAAPEALPRIVAQASLVGGSEQVGSTFDRCCRLADAAPIFALEAGRDRDGLDLLLEAVASMSLSAAIDSTRRKRRRRRAADLADQGQGPELLERRT